MSRQLNPSQVWSQVPVASRTVTVTTNNDKTGYTATVSDKTGFSLTAGSYSVRASSTQYGSVSQASGSTSSSASISSVTVTRAALENLGTDNASRPSRYTLAGSTTVTAVKLNDGGDTTANFCVFELF
jgi:hypothetical protein